MPVIVCVCVTGVTMLAPPTLSPAYADTVGYLVNVTIRPGYNFPDADAAVAYGDGICDKVQRGRPFGEIVGDVKTDFQTSDEYQASYLISQAIGELCPAEIWQLRQSAAGYRPGDAS
jgi:hypothetical protein